MTTIAAPRPAGKSARRQVVEHLARRIEHIDRSHRPLLDAIAAAPDDDLPRLVYADWLEERGQAERAEFIRVQCRAAKSGRPEYTPRVDRIVGEYLAEHLPPTSPVMLAARYVATFSPPDCPLRLRWRPSKLYRLTEGRFAVADKGDLRDDIFRWLCGEVVRIWDVKVRAWEQGGCRGRMPMSLKVTGRLIGQVFREVESHIRSVEYETRRGNKYPAPHRWPPPPDPESWHLDLFGWDAGLGVDRPNHAYTVSRSRLLAEPRVGTALPRHLRFDRGFVACGDFHWPRLWALDEVAAACARQPVSAVRLLSPDAPVARRKGNRWVIRRGESNSLWLRTPPQSRFAEGVMPAAAFDIVADQWQWWVDAGKHELEYRSLAAAETAVRRAEDDVNAAIRMALTGQVLRERPDTR